MKNILIISGANNHAWEYTTPFFKKVLEDDGRFSVTLCLNPAEELQNPEILENIDAMVLDYNGPMWPEEARNVFTAAVERGVGLIAIHAANNWTKGFDALETMLGVVWAHEAGHGWIHEFTVEIQVPDHPFAKGLTNFKQTDELYHRLTNTQNATFTVIADTYSDPEKLGSGNREPMIIANTYGKGKIIHNLLGHVWEYETGLYKDPVDNDIFKDLLIRSCLYTTGCEL